MLRKLIAIILILTVAITGFVTPAYASSTNSLIIIDNHKEIYSNDNNYNYAERTTENSSEKFINSFIDGMTNTAGALAGAVAVCFALDGLATTIFPPAATLAAFCPSLGGGAAVVGSSAGGAAAVGAGAKAVIQAVK